jgi:phosphoserine phosphatase
MAFMILYEIAKQYFSPHLSMWQSHGATIVLSTGAAVWVYRPTARRIRAAHAIEAVVENAFDAVVTADERARIVTWKRKAITADATRISVSPSRS